MLRHTLFPGGLVGFSTLDATFRSYLLLGTPQHVLPGSSFPVLLLVAEYPAEGGRGDMKPPTRLAAAIQAHYIEFLACYKRSTAWRWISRHSSRREGQTLAQGHCQGRHRGPLPGKKQQGSISSWLLGGWRCFLVSARQPWKRCVILGLLFDPIIPPFRTTDPRLETRILLGLLFDPIMPPFNNDQFSP